MTFPSLKFRHQAIVVPLLFLLLGGRAVAQATDKDAQRFAEIFHSLPHSQAKPSRVWAKKVLEKIVSVRRIGTTSLQRYLAAPTRSEALALIIAENPRGFRDRLLEYNLRFMEFMPNELYTVDPLTGQTRESPELSSLVNVKLSADEVWQGGNFFKLYDLPWAELPLRGSPASPKVEDQLQFRADIYSKPFFRILNTSPNNRNRKRAAWVLRNFLCDDLTPSSAPPMKKNTAVAPPSLGVHSGMMMPAGRNAHASEVGCRSCHWKLDYIGAFFRYMAPWGHDFKTRGKYLEILPIAVFKDQSWDEYMSEWKDQNGKWLAGVRRGSLESDPTDWNASDSIEDPTYTDLFQYLKTAPESQRCVAKRMAESFIGDNLAFDSSWLDSLGARFAAVPEEKSGAAFLQVLGEIAFSNAMSAPNPDPNQCYDVAAGKSHHAIPCRVYKVIENQCLSCHRDLGFNLDLRALVDVNKRLSLNHVSQSGSPLPPEESRQILLDRINSTDADVRMPLGKPALSDEDKAMLATWLSTLEEAT